MFYSTKNLTNRKSGLTVSIIVTCLILVFNGAAHAQEDLPKQADVSLSVSELQNPGEFGKFTTSTPLSYKVTITNNGPDNLPKNAIMFLARTDRIDAGALINLKNSFYVTSFDDPGFLIPFSDRTKCGLSETVAAEQKFNAAHHALQCKLNKTLNAGESYTFTFEFQSPRVDEYALEISMNTQSLSAPTTPGQPNQIIYNDPINNSHYTGSQFKFDLQNWAAQGPVPAQPVNPIPKPQAIEPKPKVINEPSENIVPTTEQENSTTSNGTTYTIQDSEKNIEVIAPKEGLVLQETSTTLETPTEPNNYLFMIIFGLLTLTVLGTLSLIFKTIRNNKQKLVSF